MEAVANGIVNTSTTKKDEKIKIKSIEKNKIEATASLKDDLTTLSRLYSKDINSVYAENTECEGLSWNCIHIHHFHHSATGVMSQKWK